VSWLLVSGKLLVHIVSNSIEYERALPRLGDKPLPSVVSSAPVWKEPVQETQAVPENQLNVRLQYFLFPNMHL